MAIVIMYLCYFSASGDTFPDLRSGYQSPSATAFGGFVGVLLRSIITPNLVFRMEATGFLPIKNNTIKYRAKKRNRLEVGFLQAFHRVQNYQL